MSCNWTTDGTVKLTPLPEDQGILLGVDMVFLERLDLEVSYNSVMRTEASQGPIDPALATDAFLVWDLSGEIRAHEKFAVYGAIENLTDNRYIIARQPAGARPGLPRTLVAGIKLDF